MARGNGERRDDRVKRWLYMGHGAYNIIHAFRYNDVNYWVMQRCGDDRPSLVCPETDFIELED